MTDWARFRPWIEAVLRKTGTHDFDDVVATVLRGDARLWPGRSAVMVTEFHDYPKARHLNFWIVAADPSARGAGLRELSALSACAETWGRMQGATHAVGFGRKGWGRAFPAYHPTQIMFVKELA